MLWGKLLLSLLGLACGHRLALASARGEGNDECPWLHAPGVRRPGAVGEECGIMRMMDDHLPRRCFGVYRCFNWL